MKVSNLMARCQEMLADCGDVDIGICDRNVQQMIPIESVSYVQEQNAVIIFADDEP